MIYNFRSGLAFARATKGAVGTVIGRTIGGSDYLKNRKQGHSKGESLNMSAHSTRNQQVQVDNKPKSKAKQIAGAPTRLATMPIGVIKDLMQGGVIQAGKNFFPRLRNVVKGDTLTNRAVVKRKSNTDGVEKPTTSKPSEVANNMTNETTKPTSRTMGVDVSDATKAATDNIDSGSNPHTSSNNTKCDAVKNTRTEKITRGQATIRSTKENTGNENNSEEHKD
ncbi:MAG: hypothetical protein OSJ74_07940 [Clostridia bacterium]|nr:hypothetical protein [Clostridia bacterium]